jgi:hypothetical protein
VHASRDEYPPLTALHAATYAREMATVATAGNGTSSNNSISHGISKVYDSAADAALTANKTGDDDRTSKLLYTCSTSVQSSLYRLYSTTSYCFLRSSAVSSVNKSS